MGVQWLSDARPLLPVSCVGCTRIASRQLVGIGAPIDAPCRDSSTALHIAVRKRHADVVEFLVFARASLEIVDANGRTALHYACEHHRSIDIALTLLQSGASINSEDKDGTTPVRMAMVSQNFDLMKHMVKLGMKPPGHRAAWYVDKCRGVKGREELFELMVMKGWGPLVGNGTASANADIQALVAAAAEANAAAVRTESAALAASRVARGVSSLHQAVNSGDSVALMELLISGEDPDVLDSHGRAPLHLAAKVGQVELVDALVSAKATVDVRDKNNHTPLYTAASMDEAGAVTALLHGGACPDAKDLNGFSALHTAVKRGYDAVVEALIAGGASAGVGGEKGETPLHVACKRGPPGTVATLLRAGALPGHCWNDLLQSPLMVACSAGNVDAVKQLLPLLSVRQINMRDATRESVEGGETALLIAVRNGYVDVVQAVSRGPLRSIMLLALPFPRDAVLGLRRQFLRDSR